MNARDLAAAVGPLRMSQAPAGASMAVAMSGGVDSSVAAALCLAAGYRVVGIMLRLWVAPGAGGANKCCTAGAIDDAQAVADQLGISFSVLDAEAVFRERVVDDFVARAAAGDTPNPCFTCNRRMRFGFLLDQALALGADALATGHYARIETDEDGRRQLLRGLDPDKDQSYVLHRLNQAQLARACFPLGAYRKTEVREIAARLGLRVSDRPDSVDLCWIGQEGVAGFLEDELPAELLEPGPVIDETGREVGQHQGLPRYTLGQRRGLGLALGSPRYVARRDQARNALLLGEAKDLLRMRVRADRFHWIAGEPPRIETSLPVQAQIRYRAAAQVAELRLLDAAGESVELHFEDVVRAPAPGQGLVVYAGDQVVGGGRILDDEDPEGAEAKEARP